MEARAGLQIGSTVRALVNLHPSRARRRLRGVPHTSGQWWACA